MSEAYRNIYKTARLAAGYTQESSAERLGISVESLRAYETDQRTPPSEVVELMVICYNAQHLAYEQWALEVPGVGAARVTPLWDGPGTVRVLLAGPERGPVDGTVVDACTAHVEELRPIGAAVTVASAQALVINVTASVVITGSTTLEAVQEALSAGLTAYLRSIAFTSAPVLYNRVAYILLGIDGVSDYSALTLNGGTANVPIGAEQVPVMGEVIVA